MGDSVGKRSAAHVYSLLGCLRERGPRYIREEMGPRPGCPPLQPGGTARWRLLAVGGVFLVLLSGLESGVYSRKYPESPTPAFEVVPLVAMEGKQGDTGFLARR